MDRYIQNKLSRYNASGLSSPTVLIHTQSTARVLYKQIQQPDLVMTKLGKTPNDVVSDEVRAARLGRQKELLLFPRHCAGAGVGSFG